MGWLRLLTGFDDAVSDYPFAQHDVARLHALLPQNAAVDDQTARDLLLDSYAERFAAGTSIFGRQVLHRRLRGAAATSVPRVQALVADGDLLARVETICRPLRRADVQIANAVFGAPLFGAPLSVAPRWPRWIWLAGAVWIASMVLAFLFPVLWLAAIGLSLALVAIQTVWHERTQEWDRALLPLRSLLDAHQALGEESRRTGDPLLAPFAPGADAAGRLRHRFALALGDSIPGQREYRDWLMQANVRRYFATRTALVEHLAAVRASFLLVAELEADCALARHLRQTSTFCWAEPAAAGGRSLALQDVVHPLLQAAAPISLALDDKGAFVSGQNGIGKSTLLRTVGINLVAARAFGFCYARQARVPLLPVWTSMHSEDALEGGESLYMAELRRARELLAVAGRGPAVFIVDEIFRGTNHLESVSAATAVLDRLARTHLVIVSSHNLALAPLLHDRLEPFCVAAGADGQLALRPGVLRETNGIGLMSAYGFGAEIETNALRVHGWLSRHARGEDAGPVPVLKDGVIAAVVPE